jgi:flagellar biosynthesis GTPase FlhF
MTSLAEEMTFQIEDAVEEEVAETRTYRGRSLEEVLPKVIDDLGREAVIVRQREGIIGGVAGFFGKRCVEVEAQVPASALAPPRSPSEAIRARERGFVLDAYDTGDVLKEAAISPLIGGLVEQARPFADVLADAEDVLPFELDTAILGLPPEAPSAVEAEVAVEVEAEAETEIEPEIEPDDEVEVEPPAAETEPVAAETEPVAEVPVEEAPEPVAAAVAPLRPVPAPALETAPPLGVTPRDAARAWALAEIRAIKERLASEEPHAVEHPTVSPSAATARRQVSEAAAVRSQLLEAGFGERLVSSLMGEVARNFAPFLVADTLREHARAILAGRIRVRHGWRTKRRTIALVGAPGAGKTLATAKLCHAFARAGVSVGLISLEAPRQALGLLALTEELPVEVRVADTLEEAAAASARLAQAELVLIDTPAADTADAASLERLAALVAAARPDEIHLVLPAGASASEASRQLAAMQAALGVDRLLLTHADGRCSGGVVAAAVEAGRPFSFVARGARVDGGIAPADAAELVRLVLP